MSIIGLTFEMLGSILIGIAVLLVHRRIMKEHKIDRKVIQEIKEEQLLAGVGIAFIVIGYVLQLLSV